MPCNKKMCVIGINYCKEKSLSFTIMFLHYFKHFKDIAWQTLQ